MLEDFEALDAPCGTDGDRRRGWEFVRAIMAAFDRPVAEGDGIDAGRVQAANERLGGIPAALREAYLLFGRRTDLTAAQDQLLAPEQLRSNADGILVFRVENQYCASWGIRVPALGAGQDDPPAVVNVGRGWVPYSDRLSVALVEMVLSEALMSADLRVTDNRELDDETSAALNASFVRLPIPDFPFWAGMTDSVRWFAGPDVLLRDDGGVWLWVLGRDPAAVRAVREALPGDWIQTADDGNDDQRTQVTP